MLGLTSHQVESINDSFHNGKIHQPILRGRNNTVSLFGKCQLSGDEVLGRPPPPLPCDIGDGGLKGRLWCRTRWFVLTLMLCENAKCRHNRVTRGRVACEGRMQRRGRETYPSTHLIPIYIIRHTRNVSQIQVYFTYPTEGDPIENIWKGVYPSNLSVTFKTGQSNSLLLDEPVGSSIRIPIGARGNTRCASLPSFETQYVTAF